MKVNVINIGQLDELIDKLAQEKQLAKEKGKALIDLGALGYQKLLSTGKLTRPVLVKVNSYSENAAKKIEDAGGQILGTQPEGSEEEFEETEKKAEEAPKG